MDTNNLAEIKANNNANTSELDRLKADLADTQHELDGARNTIERLSAEIRRLRERYRAASEGDR